MIEQGNAQEKPNNFLFLLKKGDLTRVLARIHSESLGEKVKDAMILMRDSEPDLEKVLYTCRKMEVEYGVMTKGAADEALFGASYFYAILKELENDGLDIPKVTKETAETYLEDFKVFFLMSFIDGLPFDQNQIEVSWKAILSAIGEKSKWISKILTSMDVIHAVPVLKPWFETLTPEAQVGASQVFDLKQRQFHADHLAKRFGEK